MELKHCSSQPLHLTIFVFNWTNVELKLFGQHKVLTQMKKYLIEPMWNWNSGNNALSFGLTRYLIEPMWNWNSFSANLMPFCWSIFNWTNVELKLASTRRAHRKQMLFNWTNVELKPRFGTNDSTVRVELFNWTNVELKHFLRFSTNSFLLLFNWTNVELKL